MSMKPFLNAHPGMTDDELRFIREMGLEHVEIYVNEAQADAASLQAIRERFRAFGLKIAIASCLPLQKNDVIDLDLKEKNGAPASRDREIERFNAFVRSAAAADIHTVSVAWQPTGIKRSGHAPGAHTRGGVSSFVDMCGIEALPNDYPRVYTEEEVWRNFAYFLERVSPTCRACGVRLALHPNDPPVPSLAGVASLIWRMEDYRRAFQLDADRVLGVKLCVGCWLEGGDSFGDLLSDIDELQAGDRILCVHFRNVSSPLPAFEETLAEDGYADMYAIMKRLVACGYEGPISIDHAFRGYPALGGQLGAYAYPTGYMKGLMRAAERELAEKTQRTEA